MPKTVAIIIGSTRPACNGKPIADWIHNLVIQQSSGSSSGSCSYELVDLSQWNLPLFDEPGVPQRDPPVHAHTRAWQDKISTFDGFIFVTPQYNWGYPAALKNALDYLYHEWKGKPAVIISYGTRGGGRAAAQLKEVLNGLRMTVTSTMPALILTEDHLINGLSQQILASEYSQHHANILLATGELEGVMSTKGLGQKDAASIKTMSAATV